MRHVASMGQKEEAHTVRLEKVSKKRQFEKKTLSLSRTRLERILKKQAGSDYFSAGRSKWRAVVNTVMGLCTA